MPDVELERTLVKSPPEVWEELASEPGLSRWLGEVVVNAADPPSRLEWGSDIAQGAIELEASGWGTKVRAMADPTAANGLGNGQVERQLTTLLDDLGSTSLTTDH